MLVSSLILLGQNVFAVNESLVLFLRFDEGSGGVVKDISGNGNDGKVIGAKWVNRKIVKAPEFDGKSKVGIPDSPSLSPERGITVMAWVNIANGSSREMAIVSKGHWTANDLPYEFTVTPGSDIFWQFYDNEGRDSCSPATPPVGEWHHLVGTYDGAKFQCFIDGEMVEEFSYKGKLPQNTASVAIGREAKQRNVILWA